MAASKRSQQSVKKASKKKPLVFITRPIPKPAIDLIKQHARVKLRTEDSWISRSDLLAGVKNADILLPILTDKVDARVMNAGKKLKLIANYGAGFNNIDVAAATKRSIPVTNTPGVLTETTAELAMTLLLAVARRVVETDAIQRRGEYPGWGPLMYLGTQVTGKTLGIVGMGRIGCELARIAIQGFNMKVVYTNVTGASLDATALGAKKVTLDTLLKQSDFVSLHVPLLDDTHHLIGKKELKAMKKTAYLVNTARGPVIDEKALVQALKANDIAGAALDVYEREPKMAAGLAKLKNTVLVPHIGSASLETRTDMGMLAANNVVAFIKGRPLQTCINPAVLNMEI